jgi:hypothetical protein
MKNKNNFYKYITSFDYVMFATMDMTIYKFFIVIL